MGCTNSKENTNPPTSTITDPNQLLINDHFRKWLKSNRPKADEYVLNDIISSVKQSNDIDDYRTIVKKTLDLLSERYDIKTTSKLNKLVQKEVSLASPKKVAYTIDVLKQTAEKLQHGQIILDDDRHQTTSTNGEIPKDTKPSDSKHDQLSSGEAGIALKEALEKARVLFYKGKQAAIFANPNGGYDVRIIDDSEDALKQDGNLLRSIIVTEVKMRPKPVATSVPKFIAPPPPTSKVIDEHEICDDFRRSIDAALKGLEAIYHTSPERTEELQTEKNLTKTNPNDRKQQAVSQTDIQPVLVGAIDSMNDIMLDTIETVTKSEIGNPIPPTHYETVEKLVTVVPNENIRYSVKEKSQSKENLSTNQFSSYSLGLPSTLQDEESTTLSSPQQKVNENGPTSLIANEDNLDQARSSLNKQVSLDESTYLTQTGLSNPNLPTSTTKLGISTSSGKIDRDDNESPSSFRMPSSISQIIEEHNKILPESSLPPVAAPLDSNTTVKSPSHNVTYTEIIHSESRDGEQSRRFITESYDECPSKDDEQTTTLKVVTKSEFSNHPISGEKIMEQSVQVITVKVRNETVKTTNPSQLSDNETSYEKQSSQNDMTI